MKETYVIWDNEENAFVECFLGNKPFYTADINSAHVYEDVASATEATSFIRSHAILRWL